MPIIKYDNLLGLHPEETELNWGRSGLKNKSPLHSVASYLAMFAPALPEYFIDRFSAEGDLVMDPFSGRGTTALRAREVNRRFVGSDLNPYALVLSRFKVSTITQGDVLGRLNDLETEYLNTKGRYGRMASTKKFDEMRIYYSPSTLASLLFIREKLGTNWRTNNDIDNAILAFAAGIMHGPTRKNGDSIYFSLDMSNSISMSPNYVRKFAKEKGLKRPRGSIFKKLSNRVKKKFDELLNENFDGTVFEHDATKPYVSVADGSISLVVTSPPYLSIVNYTTSNWIKLWLLGYERTTLREKINLSDRLKYEEYIIFITAFLNNISPKIAMGGHVCLIVGDVHDTMLIESVWDRIKDQVDFEFVEIYYDTYSQNKKVLNTMNKRRGRATMIEKVLVVRKA